MNEKTILITGASSGIGAATARLFARRGWNVAMAARSEETLHAIAAEIERDGGTALVVPADVTRLADVNRMVQQTQKRFGRIDVLVNNAGLGMVGTLAEMEMDDLAYLFQVNTFAPVAALQAVAPIMRRQGSGVIVNVSSMVENIAAPFMGAYAASKIALSYLNDAARIELKQDGIEVVNVVPGRTRTSFNENVRQSGGTGGYDISQFMGGRNGAEGAAEPSRVAEVIWLAVRKHPRRMYVSLGNHLLGEFLRRIPGLVNRLLIVVLQRYVPRQDESAASAPSESAPSESAPSESAPSGNITTAQ